MRYEHAQHRIVNPPREHGYRDERLQSGWIELYLEARAEAGLGEPQGIQAHRSPAQAQEYARRERAKGMPICEASRERIAVMVGNGMSHAAAANLLGVSTKTVQRVMQEVRTA